MRLRVAPFVLLAASAHGWDSFGHQTVGYVAQKYFTAEANATIGALIGLRDGFDIGDAAAWADTVRDKDNLPWSKNWHFINPKGDDPEHHVCLMDYPTDCSNQNCIIAAIMNQTSIVLDTSKPHVQRRNATMFLLHFFGDLHQPLHTSGFKSGGTMVRPVCWDQKAPCFGGKHLHGVWDADIPRKLRGLAAETTPQEDKAAATAWAADLFDRQQAEGMGPTATCAELKAPKCIVAYAAESNRLTCTKALRQGEEWLYAHDLSGEYFEENAGVVDAQVGKAGLRLAAWMNAIARVLSTSSEAGWFSDEI